MSDTTEPIVFLTHATDAMEDSHMLVILRNMAGQDTPLAVKKTAIFWDIRHYIASQMGLISSDIHLMLDCLELDNTAQIYTVQYLLEAKGNVVDLLVDAEEMPPLEVIPTDKFICPNCQCERDIWECMDSSSDPEQRCNSSDHTEHICCYGQNWEYDEEYDEE
jgi:hypothetical protein